MDKKNIESDTADCNEKNVLSSQSSQVKDDVNSNTDITIDNSSIENIPETVDNSNKKDNNSHENVSLLECPSEETRMDSENNSSIDHNIDNNHIDFKKDVLFDNVKQG